MPLASGYTPASRTRRTTSLPAPLINPVAYPEFSRGGCANSQKCYYFSIFCRKLHENKRIWTPRGACPWRPPPPLYLPMQSTPRVHKAVHLPENQFIFAVYSRKNFARKTKPICHLVVEFACLSSIDI